MIITATATGGAEFYSNPGDVQTISADGGTTSVGTCTNPTSTSFVCTFTGSGTLPGTGVLSSNYGTPVNFGIPATAPDGSAVITMSWQDTAWLRGRVADKRQVDGRFKVHLDLRIENQHGVLLSPATVVALLPSRTAGPLVLPDPGAADPVDLLRRQIDLIASNEQDWYPNEWARTG